MAGSLIGINEFQWAPAIIWGAMIGIIDYNFSVIEELGVGGWIGRIILILTSAIITATIGDHIIFKDTIAEEIKNRTKNNPKVKELKDQYDTKTISWKEAVRALDKLDAQIAGLDKEIIFEINNGGCYSRCEEKKTLKGTLLLTRPSKQDAVNDSKDDKEDAENEWKDYVEHLENSHNIILEIQVLYEVIFRSFASMIIFILLSMMVICIETLPLLLKSGKTGADLGRKREKERKELKGGIIR